MRTKSLFLVLLLTDVTVLSVCQQQSVRQTASTMAGSGAGLLPDYQITNFRKKSSDFDGFIWAATLTNRGSAEAPYPNYIAL